MSQGERLPRLEIKMEIQGTREMHVGDVYEELRPLMFSIAYRMVGSVSDAEDIVQDAFLRFHRATKQGEVVESPKAYLSAITTRLSIDHLRSARVRRETYVGQWLPEPILTDESADAEHHAETADSLSLAFLVMLESLSPVERAVFLLREVFGYEYEEIARVVGKSEDNCRQIAVRARHQVEAKKPRFEASRRRKEELAQRFFAAAMAGDSEGLLDLLAADVAAYGDGGGKAPAFPKPVFGRDNVARLLLGLRDRAPELGIRTLRPAEINGQPGAVFFDPEGRPVVVVSLDIAEDQILAVRAVSNPDKLNHIRHAIG
jgi:RNA polymerase sigma-70 factor (ECF subfamily)